MKKQFRPVRGAWIETIAPGVAEGLSAGFAPSAGRGLKLHCLMQLMQDKLCFAPSAGRGLKQPIAWRAIDFLSFAPSAGRGLKQAIYTASGIWPEFRPVRGAWIETITRLSSSLPNFAFRPVRGAWIATAAQQTNGRSAVFRPVRGAWIETANVVAGIMLAPFRPVRGAWIETERDPKGGWGGHLFRPVRGAWIETIKKRGRLGGKKVFPRQRQKLIAYLPT